MIIGLISDTHNDVELTKKAIDIFKSWNVEFVIHSGDLTSPKIIELFQDLKCKFVLGNCDIDIELINEKSTKCGFGIVEQSCDIKIGEKHFLIIHGNEVPIFREAVASGKYDYIIKGHTHCFENYVSNNVRIINPGSLFGTEEHSIVILQTDDDNVEKIIIDAGLTI